VQPDAPGAVNAPHLPTLKDLKKIPLLLDLEDATLTEMARHMQIRQAPKGQTIIYKGAPGNHLFFVLQGRLQAVDLSPDGREIGLNFIATGDYFGELSVIDGLPRATSVIAMENSVLAQLSRESALKLIYNNPQVVEKLLKRLASSVRNLSNFRSIVGIPSAFGRVFSLLTQLSKVTPSGMVLIEKMPTQQEIAIMVNTSRETVSRAVQVLIQRGIVEKDMRRLIIRKPLEMRKVVMQNDDHL